MAVSAATASPCTVVATTIAQLQPLLSGQHNLLLVQGSRCCLDSATTATCAGAVCCPFTTAVVAYAGVVCCLFSAAATAWKGQPLLPAQVQWRKQSTSIVLK